MGDYEEVVFDKSERGLLRDEPRTVQKAWLSVSLRFHLATLKQEVSRLSKRGLPGLHEQLFFWGGGSLMGYFLTDW